MASTPAQSLLTSATIIKTRSETFPFGLLSALADWIQLEIIQMTNVPIKPCKQGRAGKASSEAGQRIDPASLEKILKYLLQHKVPLLKSASAFR